MDYFKLWVSNLGFQDKHILDIGCGRGELIRYAINKGAIATGIDYSKSAIKYAKNTIKNAIGKHKEQSKVLKMDAKKLDFQNESFDMIFLLDIVEHLHDWELEECLKEVNRVLKKNGEVIIHTSPNKNLLDMVRIISKPLGIEFKSQAFHVNEQTAKTLSKYTNDYFKGETILDIIDSYWFNQMGERGKVLKITAKITDIFFDNPFIRKIILNTELKHIFATDIWFKGLKK